MRKIRFILLFALFLFCMCACGEKRGETVSLEPAQEEDNDTGDAGKDTIFVYVCGAVNTEGVYELKSGSRIYEAIDMAGGFKPDAAKTEINQAGLLEDGMRLYVPALGELEQSSQSGTGKVNINRASKEELMTLPGVGESRAESIIQYRKENGSFKQIEDIMRISGIKEGLYDKIKDLITI